VRHIASGGSSPYSTFILPALESFDAHAPETAERHTVEWNDDSAPRLGAAGSLVVLLVWVYNSTQVLFFGAEFAQGCATYRGRAILPRDGARQRNPIENLHKT